MNMLLLNSVTLPCVRGAFLNGKLPVLMNFSRSSEAVRTSSSGLLENVGANVLRFSWGESGRALGGILIEPQKTNLCSRSKGVSSWVNNSAVSVTDNYYLSPDGSQNASQIVTSATAPRGRYRAVTGLTPGTDYAVSAYVKSFSGAQTIRVGPESAEGTNSFLEINTATGAISLASAGAHDAYAVLLPNGWTYFRYRVVSGVAQTSLNFLAYSISGASTYSVWGAQIEAGVRASSLIQTDATVVTRAADQLSFVIPKGVTALRFVFDDNSTQDVAVTAGVYTVPTNLNRACIKEIYSL